MLGLQRVVGKAAWRLRTLTFARRKNRYEPTLPKKSVEKMVIVGPALRPHQGRAVRFYYQLGVGTRATSKGAVPDPDREEPSGTCMLR